MIGPTNDGKYVARLWEVGSAVTCSCAGSESSVVGRRDCDATAGGVIVSKRGLGDATASFPDGGEEAADRGGDRAAAKESI